MLAGSLLLLLAVVLLLPVVAVTIWGRRWDDVEGLVSAAYPAVIGVTGTALGFYFGSERKP
ncbi:MAG: hypothetical protein M3256_14765 [Actinomycetota bacterium]|nr:hypothetical protein [Actinomycetota bacterium]